MAASVVSEWSDGLVVSLLAPAFFSRRPRTVVLPRTVSGARTARDAGAAAPVRALPMEVVPIGGATPGGRRSPAPSSRRFQTRPAGPARVPVRRDRVVRPAGGRVSPVRSVLAAPTARKLRLTRRGRWVLFLVAAALIYGAFGLGQASADSGPGRAPVREVIVQPGDSLWSIAVRVRPQDDPRQAIASLRALNHLSSAEVQPGQRLKVAS